MKNNTRNTLSVLIIAIAMIVLSMSIVSPAYAQGGGTPTATPGLNPVESMTPITPSATPAPATGTPAALATSAPATATPPTTITVDVSWFKALADALQKAVDTLNGMLNSTGAPAPTAAPASATSAPAANTNTNTPAPTAPVVATPSVQNTPVVVNTAAPAAPACLVLHDYQLKDLPEVSSSDANWLHVEYFVQGSPEYETILPGNRYRLQTPFPGGHVWEYSSGCTFDQVKAQVDAHIVRRLADKANNGGFQQWDSTGFFSPVK